MGVLVLVDYVKMMAVDLGLLLGELLVLDHGHRRRLARGQQIVVVGALVMMVGEDGVCSWRRQL